MRSKRVKNAGYTLVEIIVVVAIIAITLTLVFLSVNTVFALDVRQTAKDLAGELAKEKIACMTRTGNVYLRLYKTDAGILADRYENGVLTEQAVSIGKKVVAVTYYSATNTAGIVLDSTGVIISFNRNDGSFKTIGQAWMLYNPSSNPTYSGEYYTKFVITSGGRTSTVTLYPQTGKTAFS